MVRDKAADVGKAALMVRCRSLFAVVAALASASLLAAGCGEGSDTEKAAGGVKIVVGSTGSAGSETLARIYGGALRNGGALVTYKAKADREAVALALESGEIDVALENVGSFLAFLDKSRTNGLPLAETVANAKALAQTRGLTLGEASEATDGDVLAVTKDVANAKGITRISDLQKLDAVTLAGPDGCETRQTCLVGLTTTYGLKNVTFLSTAVDVGGPATKKALTDGKAQVGRLRSSDPALASSGKFVVLEDDKSYQQAGNVITVIRTAKATDALMKVLDHVSKALTNEKQLELNKKTDEDKEDPTKVAAEFLLANRL